MKIKNCFSNFSLTIGSESVAVTVSTPWPVGAASEILVEKVPAKIGPLLFLVIDIVTLAVVADVLTGIPSSLKRMKS